MEGKKNLPCEEGLPTTWYHFGVVEKKNKLLGTVLEVLKALHIQQLY